MHEAVSQQHRWILASASHIAIATTHQVDYLATWNCSHIANAIILPRVAAICERFDLLLPYVCTPEELLGDPQ